MKAQNKSQIKFSLCFKLFSIKLGYQYIDKRNQNPLLFQPYKLLS